MADLLWDQLHLTVKMSWNKQAGTRGDFSHVQGSHQDWKLLCVAQPQVCSIALEPSVPQALWLWECLGGISELWAVWDRFFSTSQKWLWILHFNAAPCPWRTVSSCFCALLLVLGWTPYKGNLTNSEGCKKQLISCIFPLIPAQGIFPVWTPWETSQERDRAVSGYGWGGFTVFGVIYLSWVGSPLQLQPSRCFVFEAFPLVIFRGYWKAGCFCCL